jgi:hypothetical protein
VALGSLSADGLAPRVGLARCLASVALAGAAGCAPAPPPKMETGGPRFVDGVRQEPLTVDEVHARILKDRRRIGQCHRAERLNSSAVTAVTFHLTIPNTGGTPAVKLIASTRPEQRALAACVGDILRALTFPPHVGETVELDVPIEP